MNAHRPYRGRYAESLHDRPEIVVHAMQSIVAELPEGEHEVDPWDFAGEVLRRIRRTTGRFWGHEQRHRAVIVEQLVELIAESEAEDDAEVIGHA